MIGLPRPFRFVAVLVLCLLVPAGSSFAQAAKEPIRIGTFLTASGEGAFLGAPALAALQMSVDDYNERGGVLGRPLELVFYDTGLDVRKAQIAVQRLIDVDKVDVIVGGSTTGAAMAVVPLVQQAGMPFLALASGVALVEPVREWIFKPTHTDRLACRRIFADLSQRGLTRVGVISDDSGFGKSMRIRCAETAAAAGIEIAAEEVYPARAQDVSDALREIAATPDIQAILSIGTGDGPVRVTRTRRDLGIALPLYQSHGVAAADFLLRSGRAAEGVRLPAPPVILGARLDAGDPQRRAVLSFIESFKARWEVAPTVQSGYAQDALGLALAAMARAGTTDKAAVRAELEGTKGYVGVTGVISMSARDRQGLGESAFRMVEVRDGAWTVVD